MAPEEALAELTRRYFTSKGPATVNDFATWSGLTLTDCKIGIAINSACLQKVVISGADYYLKESTSLEVEPIENICLLPVYDEFIMGYKNREAYFQLKNTLKTPLEFRYDSMIIADGQIIGTWGRTVKQKSIAIVLQFFKPLGKNKINLLEKVMHRLGEFTGLTVEYENCR